ncbi:sugar phosphate isomerase/epimerase family protein [Metabacillus niabensis]|uniref:sugar phosphate isomerase/epimerase family protein n=1 Tax=Metabacillus niabensis TaxID=324854 RepID=UPI001CFB833C|nr:sugar phosphate isomerase/epimerase [Metabacillus niabensis]
MNKGKIGVQMMMLKNKVEEIGVYETLRKVRELGYRAVEVSQIPMTPNNVHELKRASEEFDIEIAALSTSVEPAIPGAPGETLINDFEKIVSDCKRLNCQYLRIGMMPVNRMGDKDQIMQFIEKAEELAGKLSDHGIELYYHTHHLEFQKFDGDYLLDIMKNNTSRLGFELDVHWIQRAGVNPVEFINQYKGRISLLHLKDYRIGKMDLSELDLRDMSRFMGIFTNTIEFAEVGEGNLDMKAIIEAGLDSGVKYFLVEQDDTYGRDPLECLRISADHLRKLGYSDWF